MYSVIICMSLQKAVIIKQKYLLGYLFVSLRLLCYFFKGSELYFFHILILHCTVVLVYKIKNNDDFIIFSIYADLCFHCPTVKLYIGDSSIRCLEKNTDVHQQIQTLIVKTDHLALNLGSKK